jgi:hypothetical protein
MKKWLIIISIIIVVFVSGYFVLSFFAVRVIQEQLKKLVGPGLSIKGIKVKPTHLSINGIRYEKPDFKKIFFEIEEVKIHPKIISLIKRPLKISRISIINPSLIVFRSPNGNIFLPIPDAVNKEEKRGSESKTSVSIINIENINIENGKIFFDDEKAGSPGAKIRFDGFRLNIHNVDYPITSQISPIELETKIKGESSDGNLLTKGWINFKKMETETDLKARDIEIKTFEPYYQKKITAEIEKGLINMNARISIKNRIIDASGDMEFVGLKIGENGTIFYLPAKILVSRLKNRDNKIKVKFRVYGNIDDPKFSINENLLTRIGLSIAETLGIPIKVVGEKIIEGTGVSTEKIIEGIKKIEEFFKKKKSTQ